MNRNAISRLIEIWLAAGIAMGVVGAWPVLAQEKVVATKPAAATKAPAGRAAVPAARQTVATQKLMRNPWEKSVEVASDKRCAR